MKTRHIIFSFAVIFFIFTTLCIVFGGIGIAGLEYEPEDLFPRIENVLGCSLKGCEVKKFKSTGGMDPYHYLSVRVPDSTMGKALSTCRSHPEKFKPDPNGKGFKYEGGTINSAREDIPFFILVKPDSSIIVYSNFKDHQ